jgi:hypothetical protein
MIRPVDGGYKVYSEEGKPLSKLLKTYKEAVERLQQVEYWKKHKGK